MIPNFEGATTNTQRPESERSIEAQRSGRHGGRALSKTAIALLPGQLWFLPTDGSAVP